MPLREPTLSPKSRRTLIILRKIVVRTLLGLILLFLLIVGLIQFPGIQNYLKNKVVIILTEKLKTKVELGYIRINFGGSLVLEDLYVADRQNDTVIYAGKIKVTVNPLAIFKKKIIFTNLDLSGVTFNYQILDSSGKTNLDFIINSLSGEQKNDKSASKSSWDIQFKKIQLAKSTVSYQNFSDSMSFNMNIGNLLVNISKSELDSLKLDIDNILLKNSYANIKTYNKQVNTVDEVVKESVMADKDTVAQLKLSLKRLDLENVTFRNADSLTESGGTYQIGEVHIIPKTIDLTNRFLEISSIILRKGNIQYTGATVNEIQVNQIKKKPPDKKNNWKISLDDGNLQLDKLRLKNIVTADNSSIDYLGDISLSNVIMDVSANFNSDKTWMFDLNSLRFEDDRTFKLITLTAGGNYNGEVVTINPLRFRLGTSYLIGSVEGAFLENGTEAIPDFKAEITSSDIELENIAPYLPVSMYKNLQRVPSQLSFTLNVTSKDQLIKGKGELKTDQGNIAFKGQMNNKLNQPVYNIQTDLKNINAGYFTQNQQLGNITVSLHASGKGFKPELMQTELGMLISNVNYNGITYKNIQLNGNIDKSQINARLTSDNPIAKLAVTVKGKIGSQSSLNLNSHITNLDLHAMGIIKDTIAISAIIDANYSGKGITNFEAQTDTLRLKVRTPNADLSTSTKVKYAVLGDSVDASVASNFGTMVYSGNIPLQNMPEVLKNYFNQYFSSEKADSAQSSTRFFNLAVDIKDLSILNDLMAMNISIPEAAHFRAELKNNKLNSNIDFKKLIYNELEIDDLTLVASGRDSSFNIDFQTAALHNKVHTIKEISLKSDLRQGNLESRLSFSNAASQKWFNIGMTMQPENPELNIVLREPLMLNHQDWQVDDRNLTYSRNDNIVFSNVKLTNGDKVISLLSDARQPEKLAVSFKNLQLAMLSEIMKGDTTFISGKIDGDLMATNLFAKPFPVFDAKLDVSNIIVENRMLGDLNAKANNLQNNDIANVDLNFGQENMKFMLKGTYGLENDIPMNLNLTAQNLSLKALQPLVENLITDASGFVNADLNIKGSFSKPDVNGEIGFDKASAYLEPIQAKFAIDKQKIQFNGERIDFNKFTINDANGRDLVINGKVEMANLKSLNYDLNITSDRFLAYQGPPDNLPGQDNKVIVTSKINVKGENNIPQVDANIGIVEGSRFFYKITKQASNLTEEGVIEFIGTDTTINKEEPPTASIMDNLDLTANITLADNTSVTIITDPVRNFGLNMKAGGTFSMVQRPYQSPRLTGRLEISDGDYTISLSGFKRKFQIADSSNIVWYGDITEPELNLRAYYEVRTSPAELLGEQSTQNTSTLPFMVNMIITGSLAEPKLNFRLSLPREYEGVNNGVVAAKLQEINSNESELNQKAMTLVLFGSFGFNNFAGLISGGAGGTNVIISNALNQFAAQKLRFVDLHFDLQSYDNYGGESQDNLRTEMKVAASKKFIDQRLDVQLGFTFVLQADEREQQKSLSERISPEFNITYLLNKPRTLSVSAFRRSEYRGLVEGKIISTGAGIMFQKDFDKISELFGKKPDETEPMAEIQKDIDEKK